MLDWTPGSHDLDLDIIELLSFGLFFLRPCDQCQFLAYKLEQFQITRWTRELRFPKQR